MVSIRLGTGADGRPVLVKEAAGASPTDTAVLRREAELLAAARHPGVVEVASWTVSEGGGSVLALRWAGGRTAADLRPPVEVTARLVAALAATVADLHGLGIRHGRIRPEHVVLDAGTRPLLCGFAGAGRAGEPASPAEADDVAGVGEVLRALVGPDTELEPIPEHRFGRRRSWEGAARRALLTLADQATHDDPTRRPTARGLAAAVAAIAPSDHPRRPAGRFPWRVVAGAVGVGLVAWLSVTVIGSRSGPDRPAAPRLGARLRAVECPAVAQPAADHDGDGCPSAVTVDGDVVEIDGVRYGIGEPGDALAVSDWDCDGLATVASVRPATGEVYVFDRWAVPGARVVVAPVALVPGAVRVEPADPGSCGGLVVVDETGRRTEVAT